MSQLEKHMKLQMVLQEIHLKLQMVMQLKYWIL